jgi:hypothetical protein
MATLLRTFSKSLVQMSCNEGTFIADLVGQKDIFSGTSVHPDTVVYLALMFRNTKGWTNP